MNVFQTETTIRTDGELDLRGLPFHTGDRVLITVVPTPATNGPVPRDTSATGPVTRPKFGSARGLITMAEDFDAPLDDFADYMP